MKVLEGQTIAGKTITAKKTTTKPPPQKKKKQAKKPPKNKIKKKKKLTALSRFHDATKKTS